MKAVVMAGGEGSRLRPLTLGRPKPMMPIVNRPVMEHILLLLKRHGITEVVVTVQYLARVIQDYFGDGEALGLRLHYTTAWKRYRWARQARSSRPSPSLMRPSW